MTKDDPTHEDPDESGPGQDDQLDEADEESFPASDPPSSWAGQNQEFDE
jgi:hypothetical protein